MTGLGLARLPGLWPAGLARRPTGSARSRRLQQNIAASSKNSNDGNEETNKTLRSLDELLPQAQDTSAAAPKPAASRGFRKTGLSKESGAFVGLDDRFWGAGSLSSSMSQGVSTADDGSDLALPACEPLSSRVLACVIGLLAFSGPELSVSLVTTLPLGSGVLALTLIPFAPLEALACCATLWLLCGQQEQLLGRGRFAAYFFITGLSAWAAGITLQLWSPNLPNPLAVTAGPAAGVLGISSAMLGYLARNWATLSADQRSSTAGAAALAASICLLSELQVPWLVDASYLAPVLTGLALGWWSGPKYMVMREPVIPDMSLTVPEDAEEVRCVVDSRSPWSSYASAFLISLAGLALSAALCWGGVQTADLDVWAEQFLELLLALQEAREQVLGDPELMFDIQQAFPDDYPNRL